MERRTTGIRGAEAFAAGLLCLVRGAALGVGDILGFDDVTYTAPPGFTLTSVTAEPGSGGRVMYTLAGYQPGNSTFIFRANAAWDPATGQAKEKIDFGDSTINTASFCPADPWIQDVPCTNQSASTKSQDDRRFLDRLKFGFPVSARVLYGERAKVKAALDAALRSVPTPTPIHHIRAIVKPVTPTPTPTPVHHVRAIVGAQPSYGAKYAPGQPPPFVRVGQAFTIAVLVTNTSSQTWTAGGAFRLGSHWVVSGVTTDGPSTPLPATVPPGGSVSVTASVTAPLSNGRWTLKWDMFQAGVGWFSAKGVPTSDQAVTISP